MAALNVSIKVTGLDELNKLPGKMRQGLIKGMKLAVIFAEGEAKKNFGAPGQLRVRSGLLRRSIKSQVFVKRSEVIGSIGSDVIYAAIHEYGGTLRPAAGKLLRFKVAGGEWRTAKSVTIPDRPYLTPAVRDNLNTITKILHESIVKEGNRV